MQLQWGSKLEGRYPAIRRKEQRALWVGVPFALKAPNTDTLVEIQLWRFLVNSRRNGSSLLTVCATIRTKSALETVSFKRVWSRRRTPQPRFFTDQSENRLSFETVEEFLKTRKNLLALESRMATLGKAQTGFASPIRRRNDVYPLPMLAGRRLSCCETDWDSLSGLVAEHEALSKKMDELAALLRKAGVPT